MQARQDYRLPNAAAAYERVIDDRNLDEFYVLSRGAMVGNAVARLFVRSPGFGSSFGTGFLIGSNLLITNNHVLGDLGLARSSQATFGHEFDIDGTLSEPATFRMTEDVFLTSVSHDYTIVSVEPTSSNGRSLSEFGHIEMLPRSGKALKREYVNIIQHPRGDLKKVALRENLVLGRRRQFLYYVTDTEPGSSGAPVFNEEFQLVALHHMAVPDPETPGQFVANRGIRVSEILKDILNKRNAGSASAAEVDQLLLQARNGSDPLPLNAPVSTPLIGSCNPSERMDESAWMENVDTTNFTPNALETGTIRPRLSAQDAYWPSSPRNTPDTWHLTEEFADRSFELNLTILKGMVEINAFVPVTDGHNKLVFALRGCKLRNGGSRLEGVTQAQLQPISPDHENFRCVIGVADTVSGELSLYSASTVPRRTQMLKYYNRVNFGTSNVLCNMLPTGCYEYCVGSHISISNGEIKFILRQGNGPLPANASTVTTLRTHNDLAYGTQDYWDRTKPGDNIHPAFLSASFSSQGCLTLPGTQSGDGSSHTTGTGEWRRFRKAAGFDGERHGARYDVLLLSGHEAAAFSATDPADWPRLACLRHGSRGELVAKLQQQINAASDGNFGPGTKKILTDVQNDTLGFATGTWTLDMARLMNLQF
ncbi:serine protease [Shimia sp. R9_3]|uniref:trypsin-like serine peptidase n=1 Tax=Shimia sp. R9_3 TaxID=2821113 RepID=UPI001ADBCC20|nr:trypsin-like peptidase domain-containing protein [Shimia sp. R9_3]